jgi:hypothetical protein
VARLVLTQGDAEATFTRAHERIRHQPWHAADHCAYVGFAADQQIE